MKQKGSSTSKSSNPKHVEHHNHSQKRRDQKRLAPKRRGHTQGNRDATTASDVLSLIVSVLDTSSSTAVYTIMVATI